MSTQINFFDVRNNLDESVKAEILNLWRIGGINFNADKAADRVNQAFAIAKSAEGQLVGVSTLYSKKDPILNEKVFYIRAFVDQNYRNQFGVAKGLVNFAVEKLNSEFDPDDANASKGLVTIIENAELRKNYTHARVPGSNSVFFGYDHRNNPCRILFFDGARIN
jgi:hypothetical protein